MADGERDWHAVSDRIAVLIDEVESIADPALRAAVGELVALVNDLHGEGLVRVLEAVASIGGGREVLQQLMKDDLVGGLLELHGFVDVQESEPAAVPVRFLSTRPVA